MCPFLCRNKQNDFITLLMSVIRVFEDVLSLLYGFFMLNTSPQGFKVSWWGEGLEFPVPLPTWTHFTIISPMRTLLQEEQI